MSDQEEVIDLHSMKVTELKSELKSRGLPVSGAKADLIDRLETYMREHEGVEVVEEEEEESVEKASDEKSSAEKVEAESNDISVNANESQEKVNEEEEVAGSPPPQNSISTNEEETDQSATVENLLTGLTEKDRKMARANRFAGGSITGNTIDELKKKNERANRFGTESSTNTSSSAKPDTLKRRAERFGLPLKNEGGSKPNVTASSTVAASTISTSLGGVDAKKLKTRAERFGMPATTASATVAAGGDKKAARAARFGM